MVRRLLTAVGIVGAAFGLRRLGILAIEHLAVVLGFVAEMVLGFSAGWIARGER